MQSSSANPSVAIRAVLPRSPEQRDFLRLPDTIYAGNRNYVPPMGKELRSILAGQHPYFHHSEGEAFVAYRDGIPAGRILLLEPKRFNAYQKRSDARFFLFECRDDQETADALFLHAAQWAKSRSLTRIVGPQGFSSFGGSGILIHGFEHPATMTMMPYHPPYYQALVEASGFSRSKDFYSARIDPRVQKLPQKIARLAEISLKRGSFTVPRVRSKRAAREIAKEIGVLYNNSWEAHDHFTPLTAEEMEALTSDLLLVTKPSLVTVIRAGDELVGFALAFPDLTDVLSRARGRITLREMISLYRAMNRPRRLIINGMGILPRYRRTGALAILFSEIAKILDATGVRSAEFTQISAENDLMMSNLEKLNAEIYKTHRIYTKVIA